MTETYELNFMHVDPEAICGITNKKYTAVNTMLSFVLGAVFTGVFYGILWPLHRMHRYMMVDMFFHGGVENRSTIPYYTMLLTWWCIAFIFIKWLKLRAQRKSFQVQVLPDTPGFALSRMNASQVIGNIHARVFMSERFMPLWRIECALSNLNNIGKVSEISSLMKDLADNDRDFMESSYTLPKGLIWAIPVLGFIGTVLGLSQAVGGFGSVVASGADLETLKTSLGGVTSGLGTAFETTLIALVAALFVQLLMTMLSQREEEFLDACADFCYRNVTSRLTMMDLAEGVDET